MSHNSEDTVRQIIPADGWMGVYKSKSGYFFARLAGWALIEDEYGWPTVVGLESGPTSFIHWSSENLIGYIHEKDVTPEVRRSIDRYLHGEED